MRIVKLTAENFKRLKAVDITPDGDVVVISGRNGQGKTSVLDAMWQALGGGPAAKGTPHPVRDGEESAVVTLDLGDLVVTRKWTAEGKTTLTVANGEGARYSSPQSMLDGLVGKLCFDPLEFSRLPAKDQLAQLLDLVDLPFDVDDLAAQRRGVFDTRTNVNRDLKAAQARLAAMPVPAEDTPEEEVSAADVLARADAARAEAASNADRRRHASELAGQVGRAVVAVQALEEQLADARETLATTKRCADEAAQAVEGLVDPDVDVFTLQLAELEQTNAAVRAAQARAQLANEVETLAEESDALTAQLAVLDDRKALALAEATMPISGLAFDEEGVTYKGVPFSQCSSAEQLRVSVAMAIALNPEVRVIRITDGSLLDSASMKLIADMADAHDYQVWVEVVDETGELGVVIEDGAVVHTEAVAS